MSIMSNILRLFEQTLNFNIFLLLLVIFVYPINIANCINVATASSLSSGKSVNLNKRNHSNQPNTNLYRYRRAVATSLPQSLPFGDTTILPYNASITSDYAAELMAKLLPKEYNKNLRPNFGGPPTVTSISLRIHGIIDISETDMACKVDLVVRHYWKDPRLTFASRHNISVLHLGEEFAKKIWLPDTFMSNGRETETQKTVTNTDSTLLRIAHDGEILYTTRLVVTANCPMDLTYFPLDQQKCSILIASYGLSDQDIVLNWVDNHAPVEISLDINLPTFKLRGYNRHKFVEMMSTGNYTRLIFDMFIARSIGFYVMQVYIPAFLIVVISWVPFWLNRDNHHARVALAVTTVLTMTTLITKTNSDFSKISHLKAIDVYLFTCFMMVFASLFEYAAVGYYEFKRTSKGTKNNEGKSNQRPNCKRIKPQMQMEPLRTSGSSLDVNIVFVPKVTNSVDANDQVKPKKNLRRLIKDTSFIDNLARRAFPTIFISFNLAYGFLLVSLARRHSYEQEYEVKLN